MATFGNAETIAGTASTLTSDSGMNATDALGCKFTTPSDCTSITSLTAYCTPPSGGQGLKACVWASDGSLVTNGVSTARSALPNTADYYTFTFATPPTVSASTVYYFGFVIEYAWAFYYKAGAANQQRYDSVNSYTTPTTLGTDGQDAQEDAWYMTYTPSVGSTDISISADLEAAYGQMKTLDVLEGGHWIEHRTSKVIF